MALAERVPQESPKGPKGKPKPRVAPPTPARSLVKELGETAIVCGFQLMPWQVTAGRYLMALGPGKTWLYPEVAVIVSRQQGKTTLLEPLIVKRLRDGARIMHTAQNRELPREVFAVVADIMQEHYGDELRAKPRFANGQEEIRLRNGGLYRIVAPTRGGARGPSNDLVIVDELREMTDPAFIAAAKPTLLASPNPQMVYLSNAGTEESVVLNALKARASDDPSLAYLEWSAAPDREPDDFAGWLEANPAIGHNPSVLPNLEREYRANLLGGTMGIFETEHLCRWYATLRPTILDASAWTHAEGCTSTPRRPVMGIALHPSGSRASAAIAWQEPSGGYGLEVFADVTGDPIDLSTFGPELRRRAAQLGVTRIVFDPYDEHLARFFRNPVAMNGRDFANACATFVRLVESEQLRWRTHPELGDVIGRDLPRTTKRGVGPGAWMAVRTSDDQPITAVLAAIRAVGSAFKPPITAGPRIF
jgi:hypothetical protein